MSTHHTLDIHPEPEKVLYINEPWLADTSLLNMEHLSKEPDVQPDNIRVYVPLDLNREAIIRRMYQIGARNGHPTEGNEFNYSTDVQQIITQLEIYDQVWYVRERDYADSPEKKHHSKHGKELAEALLDILEQWEENSAAEMFPIDQIDELEEEYEIVRKHHWK